MNHTHSKTPTPAIEFHRGRPEFPSEQEPQDFERQFEKDRFKNEKTLKPCRALETPKSEEGDRNR
jgi:hypothetical protein